MPQKKHTTHSERRTAQAAAFAFWRRVRSWYRAIESRIQGFLKRRPHRSFRLSRRRDYTRSLKLPGYWAFTAYVFRALRSRRALFVLLVILYTAFSVILGTMTSQDTYRQMAQALEEGTQSVASGNWAELTKAGVLSVAAVTNGLSQLSDVQQLYLGISVILTWLTTVWLLREILAGRKPNLRDGLYNGAAPVVSTVLVALYLLLQSLPVWIMAIAYAGLSSVGIISEGFAMYLFSAIAILIVALTLYWMTSTFFALVIVTLPGMYPSRAIRAGGDLVVGRRLRIVYRLLWMALLAAVIWLAIMIPLVLGQKWLFDHVSWSWLQSLPIIPFFASLLSTSTAVWMASYIYLLYRKVVDDDSAPTR